MTESLDWYIKSEEISGPYSTKEMISQLKSGKISQDTLLIIGETGQWQPASTYLELQVQPDLKRPLVRPWVRLAARYLDMYVWSVFISIILTITWKDISEYPSYALGIIFCFIWIPIETILLTTVGTTLGKTLLGIKVRTADGNKLLFKQALKRSFIVWWKGQGAGVPVLSLICNINAYQSLIFYIGKTKWDRDLDIVVTHRNKTLWNEIIIYLILLISIYLRFESAIQKYL
jgi:uncharacterized RDD family membrane protein YckC